MCLLLFSIHGRRAWIWGSTVHLYVEHNIFYVLKLVKLKQSTLCFSVFLEGCVHSSQYVTIF